MQADTLPKAPKTGPRFRDFMPFDVDEVVALGASFFKESEFTDFAEFSPDHFRFVLTGIENSPSMHGFVFEDKGKIRGFLFYQLDLSYTEKPIALLWLLYVKPKYRRSPIGRELLKIAEGHAKASGATAFYGGVMSGIQAHKNSMRNLYTKAGYEELYWGRKILKGEDNE